MEYLFCARHSPCVAIWVSSVPWGKRRNEGTVQDGTASVLRLAERGFEPGVSTPARTRFHHLPPATEGRATGRKRIRTRRVHARTHPLPPPCLPQRKAERLAERGFEPGVSTPARTRFHHPASHNGRQSNWQKEDSNPAVSTPARTHFHHPASRNGRQSTHAKANIMRTFLHVLFIHKNDTNWLVL